MVPFYSADAARLKNTMDQLALEPWAHLPGDPPKCLALFLLCACVRVCVCVCVCVLFACACVFVRLRELDYSNLKWISKVDI